MFRGYQVSLRYLSNGPFDKKIFAQDFTSGKVHHRRCVRNSLTFFLLQMRGCPCPLSEWALKINFYLSLVVG